jgi:hypothetical protein
MPVSLPRPNCALSSNKLPLGSRLPGAAVHYHFCPDVTPYAVCCYPLAHRI